MDRVADAPLLNRFRVVNADSTLGPVITQAVRSNLEESSVLSFYAPSENAFAERHREIAEAAAAAIADAGRVAGTPLDDRSLSAIAVSK